MTLLILTLIEFANGYHKNYRCHPYKNQLQTVFVMPTLIVSYFEANNDWTDLVNIRVLSILISFASFAWTFYSIRYFQATIKICFCSNNNIFRDMEKRGSLKGINLFILILKVILDAVSRILLFSTWLYVINGGQFSSWITVTAYYVTFIILLVFNVTFSWKTENLYSSKYWIGKKSGKIL